MCDCEQHKAKCQEKPLTIRLYDIICPLLSHKKRRSSEICYSHFPLSSLSFFFSSSWLEEINLAPFAEAGSFPWPFLSALFQKGKALQPEQFALQTLAGGHAASAASSPGDG
ncbi:hypothetical protein NQZ68_019154 [Dissostichus eleginoides]|nr:hypothetical protein NQZ68_019154 [Dissostichus eleginoides]